MTSDIKIYNQNLKEDSIWILDGVEFPDDMHRPNCAVPIFPFRLASNNEILEILTDDINAPISSTIGIINIPEEITATIRGIDFSEVNNFHVIYNTSNYKEGIKKIAKYISRYLKTIERFQIHNIIMNKPNLKTLTIDKENGKFIGMHIDSWDLLKVTERINGTNRLCINLGNDKRYFLFVKYSCIKMYEMLNFKQDLYKLEYKPYEIINAYFKQFPNTKIYAIKLEPNEAYIAPTENIIHEGSSFGTKFIDLNLTFRGFFNYFYN